MRQISCLILLTLLPSFAWAQMGGPNMTRGMSGIMLLSGGKPYRADGKLLQMDDAIAIAQQYLSNHRTSSIALDEIEEWEYNYYVVVKEISPSNYKAFQLVIDKWSGSVQYEPGPNMMWNTKYCYSNMMGCGFQNPQRITAAQATQLANTFLTQHFPGQVVIGAGDLFYGFYTFDVKKAKKAMKMGMLSVNWNTGQVWYHTWHGRFIRGREL